MREALRRNIILAVAAGGNLCGHSNVRSMSKARILADVIDQVLKPARFKKKKLNWYLDGEDTIGVLNLQKSNYGEKYYINLALWIKQLGDADAPQEHKCHVRCRWEDIVKEDEKLLERLLNLEIDVPARDERLRSALTNFVVPFFMQTRSIEQIKQLQTTDLWPPSILVRREAQELLNPPS